MCGFVEYHSKNTRVANGHACKLIILDNVIVHVAAHNTRPKGLSLNYNLEIQKRQEDGNKSVQDKSKISDSRPGEQIPLLFVREIFPRIDAPKLVQQTSEAKVE
jgi:hypothetical protein